MTPAQAAAAHARQADAVLATITKVEVDHGVDGFPDAALDFGLRVVVAHALTSIALMLSSRDE